MSHITGTVQVLTPPIAIGPAGGPATSGSTWTLDFTPVAAPGGTKLVVLHFQNVALAAGERLEVDLGYATDRFTSTAGGSFWTRPVNVYLVPGGKVPIRFIGTAGTAGGAQLDRYGRGEQHSGEAGHPSVSNCDPFLGSSPYVEPTYDPWWSCVPAPVWENVACVPAGDIRAEVARSVGMIISAERSDFTGNEQLSTCSVTLVDADKVITAGHCHTAAEALGSSVTFDYAVDCNGSRPAGYSATFYKVVEVLAHAYDPTGLIPDDYSLLRLAEAPPGIPAIQLRHDLPGVGEQVFGIHHPNGAVKKVSVPHPAFAAVIGSSAAAINVPNTFDVSGGSSGSGLFDAAGRIVGVLSNGDPCGHPAPGFPLRYYPTASIAKTIAPAPPPPVSRDVMVVFDRSGSMSELDGTGRTKIDAAADAVSLFVQLIRVGTGNRVGLVSFESDATNPIDAAIGPADAPHKTALAGAAPYAGGIVGALNPGGTTSIGDGLEAARGQFPTPGSNPRAILLMTDGMQNTPRWISDVDGALNGIAVHAIGFGTDANLDGAVLASLTASHGGLYTRAESGLALEKFFAHAFGNIFEAGTITDPEFFLPARERRGQPLPFTVCGEDAVTVVAGWDRTDADLLLLVTTPGGTSIVTGSPNVAADSGRTWAFLRIPLAWSGERDGTWTVTVIRPGGGEFPPPGVDLRYFINVVATGGPTLRPAMHPGRLYTGDRINPLVSLRYRDGSWSRGGSVSLSVTRPKAGLGTIIAKAGLKPPVFVGGDTIPARQATVREIEASQGAPAVAYHDDIFTLGDDSASTRGAFEEAALWGRNFDDLLTIDGTYLLHYKATYGECAATRETMRSLTVDVGVDSDHTMVTVQPTGQTPAGGNTGTLTMIPADRFGNLVGPGRGPDLTVDPGPDTVVAGPIEDLGDGSYRVPVEWPAGGRPTVVVGQPGRPPVVVSGQTSVEDRCCDRPWRLIWLLILLLAIALLAIVVVLLVR
jgi:hypothetical protein